MSEPAKSSKLMQMGVIQRHKLPTTSDYKEIVLRAAAMDGELMSHDGHYTNSEYEVCNSLALNRKIIAKCNEILDKGRIMIGISDEGQILTRDLTPTNLQQLATAGATAMKNIMLIRTGGDIKEYDDRSVDSIDATLKMLADKVKQNNKISLVQTTNKIEFSNESNIKDVSPV